MLFLFFILCDVFVEHSTSAVGHVCRLDEVLFGYGASEVAIVHGCAEYALIERLKER